MVQNNGVIAHGQGIQTGTLFPTECPQTAPDARRALFEAVADQTMPAWRRGLTSSARGCLNRAAAELRSIGASPEEVVALVNAYRKDMPTASLTPSALAKHAPRLRKPLDTRNPLIPREVTRCASCGGLVGIDCQGCS